MQYRFLKDFSDVHYLAPRIADKVSMGLIIVYAPLLCAASTSCWKGIAGITFKVSLQMLSVESKLVLEAAWKLDGASDQERQAASPDWYPPGLPLAWSDLADEASDCTAGTCRSLYWGVGKHLDSVSATNVSAVLFMIAVTPGFSATTYVPSLVMERLLFYR